MIALALLACAGPPGEAVQAAEEGPVEVVDMARTGGGCASSCALDASPDAPMTRADFDHLLTTWAAEPVGEPTLALETLLFHGPETRSWLAGAGTGPLDEVHAAFLSNELQRDAVRVEMRLVDERGRERGTLVASNVGLADKNHLVFSGTGSLGHLETGGKVKRVGLGHLWSRW